MIIQAREKERERERKKKKKPERGCIKEGAEEKQEEAAEVGRNDEWQGQAKSKKLQRDDGEWYATSEGKWPALDTG